MEKRINWYFFLWLDYYSELFKFSQIHIKKLEPTQKLELWTKWNRYVKINSTIIESSMRMSATTNIFSDADFISYVHKTKSQERVHQVNAVVFLDIFDIESLYWSLIQIFIDINFQYKGLLFGLKVVLL